MNNIAQLPVLSYHLSDEEIMDALPKFYETNSCEMCIQTARDIPEREYWRQKWVVSKVDWHSIVEGLCKKYISDDSIHKMVQSPMIDFVSHQLVVFVKPDEEEDKPDEGETIH